MTFDTLRPLFNYLLAVGLAVTLALGLASSPQAAEREAPPASAGRPATPPAADENEVPRSWTRTRRPLLPSRT